MINHKMTIENARRKARNYANHMGQKVTIIVYNDNAPEDIRGHHLVEWGPIVEYHLEKEEFDFVEELEPNDEPVEYV